MLMSARRHVNESDAHHRVSALDNLLYSIRIELNHKRELID